MSLIGLLITLVVVGILLWLLNNYVPIDGKILKIINVIVMIVVVLWLLGVFGLLDFAGNVRVPRIH